LKIANVQGNPKTKEVKNPRKNRLLFKYLPQRKVTIATNRPLTIEGTTYGSRLWALKYSAIPPIGICKNHPTISIEIGNGGKNLVTILSNALTLPESPKTASTRHNTPSI